MVNLTNKSFCIKFKLILIIVILSSCNKGVSSRHVPTDNDPVLRIHALKILPFILSVEEYQNKNNLVPDSFEIVSQSEILPQNVHYYKVDKNEFEFMVKIGWDSRLIYNSSIKEWHFNPGDGGDLIKINFNFSDSDS